MPFLISRLVGRATTVAGSVNLTVVGGEAPVAHQVHNTRLHDRCRPGRGDRVGQTLQPVTHDHQDVFRAPVLDLGEHLQPVLRALPTVPGPQVCVIDYL